MKSFFLLFLSLTMSTAIFAQSDNPLSFRVKLAQGDEKFTGRLLLTLTKYQPRPVVKSINWFNPEPAFALDVKDWKVGQNQVIDDRAISYPFSLKSLPKGTYYAQACIDRDLGGISVFNSPGNGYSNAVKIEHDPEKSQVIDLVIDQTSKAGEFPESKNVKLVDMESKLLSTFHKKPMRMRAGVVLPPSYFTDEKKTFPVVYEITGFGGDHTFAPFQYARKQYDLDGLEVIWVVLDANCRLGHHVFADSENNGPVGKALIDELIPHIEKTFRAIGTAKSRLVTGHSSGGWSSLWLQTTYPDSFAGCWSTSPDPVDFRDFQRVNLYETKVNYFTDSEGQLRDLSRGDRGKTLKFKTFSQMEEVMGRGGQLASFEAVFSPRMPDGQPRPMWNRKTGEIDPVTVKAWEKYDIRQNLESNWARLGPKLKGKVNVWMGELDTFYLDGAARLLKESQAKLEGGAVVEMFPKKTHGLMDRELSTRMKNEMKSVLQKD